MPGIIRVKPVAGPHTALHLPKRVDNPSPDGEWNLVFHTPREWHMGADGWQVKLFHRGRDVTRQHRDFFRIADGKGFQWEPHFRPWSFDSRSLAISTWDQKPLHLYEVALKRGNQLSYERGMRSVQWAPDMDRLLLTYPTEGVLVNQAGEQHALIQWGIADGETAHTDWLKTGKCFFVLARQAGDSRTSIRFYSGVEGTLKGTHELDPLDLVPYNWAEYVELSRNEISLISADHGFRSVGSLLDTWSDVKFEQASNTLMLGVFRPVSSPRQEAGQLVCEVRQSWIAIELDPN